MNISEKVLDPQDNKHISRMVKAIEGWEEKSSMELKEPTGMFGQKTIVKSGGVTIDSDDLDIEFSIPFDDDIVPNEAEICVFNLSKNTIAQLKTNAVITVEAGYNDDTGVIFSGRISQVKTKREGCDDRTIIKAIDKEDFDNDSVQSLTYKKGVKASYILKDLISKLKLPVAMFQVAKDITMKEATNIDGALADSIKEYSEMCGAVTYINGGKVYTRPQSKAIGAHFEINEDTGLIGSPEEFEETVTNREGESSKKEKITGYKLEMLLQHQITTGASVNLKSLYANGKYVVRKGQHTCSGTDFTTEIEVI